jgi:hypothetical protein
MEASVIWESPPIIKPEFRLYYDERGCVLFYTCEKPEGNYIVIDSNTYAQGRPDVRVVDGKITSMGGTGQPRPRVNVGTFIGSATPAFSRRV